MEKVINLQVHIEQLQSDHAKEIETLTLNTADKIKLIEKNSNDMLKC